MNRFGALKKSHWITWLLLLKKRCRVANVSDSAVVLSYYILLSICPLLIVIGSLLNFIGVSDAHLDDTLILLLPERIYRYLKPVIRSSLHDGGRAQLSLGLLITLWSASRMIAAFQRTVNLAYGIHRPSAVINRLESFVWMVLFVLFTVSTIFFSVFGKMLVNFAVRYYHWSPAIPRWINNLQLPATLVVLYLVVCALYYFVPIFKVKFRFVWQGALVATVGMMALSRVFSLYLTYFSNRFSTYHALGTFVILMFWLYFFGLLLLFGAVVNATNQEYARGNAPSKN